MPNYVESLPTFIAHFGMGVLLLAVFASLYSFFTEHDELALVREGNQSAALVWIGALVGAGLPIAAAVHGSFSVMAQVQWGVIAIVIQLVTYLALRYGLRTLSKDIIDDRRSVAIVVATVSVLVGLINAAAIP